MGFDAGFGFNLSTFDRSILVAHSYAGLTCLKCAVWVEGPTHGGQITSDVVTVLWDSVSEYENLNGMTDYRKVFVRNNGSNPTGPCIIRSSFVAPSELVGRLACTMAIGTSSDTMADKPADTSFGNALQLNIDPGESAHVWLKRTVSPTNPPAKTYLGVQFVLTVTKN